jgi:hypothetical protein
MRRLYFLVGIAVFITTLFGAEAWSADCNKGAATSVQGIAARIGLASGFMSIIPGAPTSPCTVQVVLVPVSKKVPCRVGQRFSATGVVEDAQDIGRTLVAETLSCQ